MTIVVYTKRYYYSSVRLSKREFQRKDIKCILI